MAFHCRYINFFIFLQTKFSIGYENFIVVFNSSRPDVQIHVTRQHLNILSHAIVDLTRCVTKSVLISFDIFLNIYSAIYDVLKIIQKS